VVFVSLYTDAIFEKGSLVMPYSLLSFWKGDDQCQPGCTGNIKSMIIDDLSKNHVV